MATSKVVVRKKRADGFYPVYIRVVHRSRMGYIKTDKLITDKQITKNGEIKDIVVNEYCSREILRYSDMINRKDVSNYSVAELIEFLIHSDEEICFSDYATKFINRMASEGHERNAKNYRLAVNHLERYLGTTRVMFTHLSSSVLTRWINSLSLTNRAKEMYPTCLRQIFKRALIELNDEERGIVRIKYNPWLKVSIPKSDSTVQRAISAEACREFFNRPLPETKMISSLPELGRDVALLSLCLGGINTVDIFELKKENYKDGIIGYKRAKTKHSRKDEAYIEMRVEPFIQATFDKYLSDENDEYLFKFHKRYSNPDSFNANVNIGIRKICADMGMKKEDYYCYYTFRHTWATIAQNDCDANLYEVAFGMNHSHGLNITRGYVKIDFTPAWELVIGSLNALVLNRLITRVNSKGNIPVSIIVDELPTLYFHKIDRLIGTARSNKVAVTLGFQELPQLEADYGKVGMQKIITTCGNIFMGAARNKETLEWAQNDVFGKAKQTSRSISINDHKVSTTISEKMDFLVPAAKIADMATGWLAGQAARDFTATDDSMLDHFDIEQSEEFRTTKYFCKTHFDMKKIKDEEKHYVPLPKIYEFKNDKEKEILLNRNFKRVNQEVEDMVKELLGIS